MLLGAGSSRLDRRPGDGHRPFHSHHGRADRHQLVDPDPKQLGAEHTVALLDETGLVRPAPVQQGPGRRVMNDPR